MDLIAWASVVLSALALIPITAVAAVILSVSGAVLALFRALKGRWQLWPVFLIALATAALGISGSVPLWFSIPAAVALAGVGYWLLNSPIPHTPEPSGPHHVGLRKIEFQLGDARQQIYLWYPATPPEGSQPRRYFTAHEAKAFGSVYRAMGLPGVFTGPNRLARTQSHEDAPVKPNGGAAYPLLIFNHGGAMSPLQSLSLMETLASQGYVVISLTHPGDSAGIAWTDGAITGIDKAGVRRLKNMDGAKASARYLLAQSAEEKRQTFEALKPHFENTLSAMTRTWADRTSAVLDVLSTGDMAPEVQAILDQTDLQQVGFIGMSLGGSVSHDLCHRDRRAAVGVNLDGINWRFEWAGKPMPVPFLQVHADPDVMAAQAARLLREDVKPSNPNGPLSLPNDIYYETAGAAHPVKRYYWQKRGHMFFTDQPLASKDKEAHQDVADLAALVVAFLGPVFGKETPLRLEAGAQANPRLVELTSFSSAPSSSH